MAVNENIGNEVLHSISSPGHNSVVFVDEHSALCV